MEITLISHELCPYVQRAAIVLHEKGVAFERRWVNLSMKPDWFTAVSPLGKTPVLMVGQEPIFESAVICEYLDEAFLPRMHPDSMLQRARHRAWMEFGSSVLNTIAAYYSAMDSAALDAQRNLLRSRFAHVEQALGAGPYFAGDNFGMVDAVFAPVFRYFDAFEAIGEPGIFDQTPKVRAWREALAARDSVRLAAVAGYPEKLLAFLKAKGSEISRRIGAI